MAGWIDLTNDVARTDFSFPGYHDLFVYRASAMFTPTGAGNIRNLRELHRDALVLAWADLNFAQAKDDMDPDTEWKFDYDQSLESDEIMKDGEGMPCLNWAGDPQKWWMDPVQYCPKRWADNILLYTERYHDMIHGWLFDYASETPWVLPDGRPTRYHEDPWQAVFKGWIVQALDLLKSSPYFDQKFIVMNGRWALEKDDLSPWLNGILAESMGSHWFTPEQAFELMQVRLGDVTFVVIDRTQGPKAGGWDVWSCARTLEFHNSAYVASERR